MACVLLIGLFAVNCHAHKPSDSYLRIATGVEKLTAEWDIALKDLEFLVGLDVDQNGAITWGELKEKRSAIVAHALSRLEIAANGNPCVLRLSELKVNRHSDGAYAVLKLESDCPSLPEVVSVSYNLLFDVDPTHRGLVLFDDGQGVAAHVLTPELRTIELRPGESRLGQTFVEYTREGIWHIWIGLDHILFLLALLLPAVLVRTEGRWQPVDDPRPAWTAVLKIVTVFTIAHSITLWLAVMEYVTLPGWLVESTIAFSIIVTALNNLYPLLPASGWAIAFGFGLVHGFGFANVLLDLGLSSVALAVSLLGFNVGVELGQLAIVAVFFPAAYWLRGTWLYQSVVLQGGSAIVAVIAVFWMIERSLNVEIIGI